ncbi:MAG: prepilin-type N-terminal cleavage/methylation domain-containing protein [Actinomycetota bacterium]|nr:prepilin-type N-terminal cleavage/methylation domain-containing protein [Actinomycetota bacterium]
MTTEPPARRATPPSESSRGRLRFAGRGEEGFSLVEVLVAIALFGVVAVGFAGAMITATRSVAEQSLRTAATRVATDHLETLRGLPSDLLDAEARQTTVSTPAGRSFTVDTAVTRIDAVTGAAASLGEVRQVTATVRWTSRGTTRSMSTTTAVTPPDTAVAARSIGAVTMFPSPATVDGTGTPLTDIEVTVPLQGFAPSSLVYLSWPNAGLADGAQTLTAGASGLNWRGVIARDRIRAAVTADGRGAVTFTVTAQNLVVLYTLAVQVAVPTPPAITAATIDRSPITVDSPAKGKTCADSNQCQNTTDVTFTATVANLSPAQDRVILQYQLYDGSSQELPLTPSGDRWVLTVRQKTMEFMVGTERRFRFTAIRGADGATAASTVLANVVAT